MGHPSGVAGKCLVWEKTATHWETKSVKSECVRSVRAKETHREET